MTVTMEQVEVLEDDPYVQPLTPPAQVDTVARFRPGSRAPRPLTPRRPVELHITASGRIYYTREPGTRY
jgi:hypothetical protein